VNPGSRRRGRRPPGGEHRGRLVEDQQAGVAVERLEDLDPLLEADREVLDQRVGVDRQPGALGQFTDLGGRPCPVEPAEPRSPRCRA
jgi:hypothetical protein